ncbi:MAG: hypothetical protein RMY36_026155 [Nostoc sp. SerVER01]
MGISMPLNLLGKGLERDFYCILGLVKMSDRANYILIDKKKNIGTYYDKWCLGTISRWLLSNSEQAISDLLSMQPDPGYLLNEIWCDSAVLIDDYNKVLKFFIGAEAAGWSFNYPLIQAAVSLAQERWVGWSVTWAYKGIAEISEYIGLNPKFVISKDSLNFESVNQKEFSSYQEKDPQEFDFDTGEVIYVESRWIESLITVKYLNSSIYDYCFPWDIQNILLLGTKLLPMLQIRQPTSVLPSEAPNYEGDRSHDHIESGVYIDEITKKIYIWWRKPRERGYILEKIVRVWSSWSIEQIIGGLQQQYELSNRSLQNLTMSPEQAKEILRKYFK